MKDIVVYALAIIILAEIISIIVKMFRDVVVSIIDTASDKNDDRGSIGTTLVTAVTWAIMAMVWFFALAIIALRVGLPQSLMTVVSAAGVAIAGVGSQRVLGDVASGTAILAERQILIGDRITIVTSAGEEMGVVKDISLRIIRVVTDTDGEVIVPMGKVDYIRNHSSTVGRFKIAVPVNASIHPQKLTELLAEVIDEVSADPAVKPLLVHDGLETRNINSLNDGRAEITIVGSTIPGKQWEVKRHVNDVLMTRISESDNGILIEPIAPIGGK